MKKLIALSVILGIAAVSATAEAIPFAKWMGGGSLFGKMTKQVTMPAASVTTTVPQEPCYRFAYTAQGRDGIGNVFSGGNCLSEPKNVTNYSDAVTFSHLAAGRTSPNLAFFQDDPTGDFDGLNLMVLMNSTWDFFGPGSSNHYEAKALAWDASGRLAILSREEGEGGDLNGPFALRLKDGPFYSLYGTTLVQTFGMVPPQDMEWVMVPGHARSRYLIVSFGSFPATTQLYVLDTEASPVRPVPLEETAAGGPYLSAMIGSQPALGVLGESLLLVRGGRILSCNLDLSHMDDALPRAYCPDAWEVQTLRDLRGEMASPSVSPDDQSLFFSMKRSPTASDPAPGWDIYRIRFDHFELHQLTATPDVDEKEIVSIPNWLELTAVTAQRAIMVFKEEPKYQAVTTVRANYQVHP
jgi:hypothetical protein